MPVANSTPVPGPIKAYIHHGLDLSWEGKEQAEAECPFCGKVKWRCSVASGLWDCKVCGATGNQLIFLRMLHELATASPVDLSGLVTHRKLLSTDTLTKWGVTQGPLTLDWMFPGYNRDGNIVQLYRYVQRGDGRWVLLATPELSHGIHGVPLFDPAKEVVYIMEGPWDGMALWETLQAARTEGEGQRASVLAVPGCNVFHPSWATLLADKIVVLMYDNDHPHEHGGRIIRPGYDGMERVARLLANCETPPKEIKYLQWGAEGHDPNLPSGHDVRDWLSDGATPQERVRLLHQLCERIAPVPADWLVKSKAVTNTGEMLTCLHCETWTACVSGWRKAIRLTDGLHKGLAVILASAVSTRGIDEQLWIRLISPPSSGKTTLCEGISVARKFVFPTDTMTSLISGYQTDKEGTENMSLVSKLKDKTLIIKDGDTMLSSPQLPKMLGQLRALFDKKLRTQFGNKMSADYEQNTTVIIAGTSALRALDRSELGERWLDCIIMNQIDDDLEDDILWRVANRTARNAAMEADGKAETRYDPDMAKAMQLTGGYVEYLRENARRLLGSVVQPKETLQQCVRLGKFVAYMRARPSKIQDEYAEREFGARLVSQITRLSVCLAVVLNKRSTADPGVMQLVKTVAMDTARGRTFDVVRVLAPYGEEGLEVKSIVAETHETEDKERSRLRFLRKIGAVDCYRPKRHGAQQNVRWKLTPRMLNLYNRVMEV
jgi:hypothetical protein